MKRLVFLFFLFFQIGHSFAQATDTTKQVFNADTLTKHGALFVMEGVVLQKPYHFNPDSIVDITIITRDKANELFHSDAQNDVVILLSRCRAIADYQKKFSALSKAYKKYLQTHQNDDKDVLYVANGVSLNAKDKIEIIRKLYKISNDNLKKVGYSDNFVEGMKHGATVFITTKQ